METLFLVKKNPMSVRNGPQWITLNLEQFKTFLKTKEAKGRFFLKIEDDLGGEAPRIYCEVDEEKKKEMLKEQRHSQYINDMKKKYGYQTVSFQCMDENSDDECAGEEVLTYNDDFVDNVVENIYLEKLFEKLTEEEKWLLQELALSEEKQSVRTLSKKTGIPRTTLDYRKRELFKKIKNFL